MTAHTPYQQVEIFFSYSHRDEDLRDELEKHLSLLKRQQFIVGWHDRRIGAGEEWANEISSHLESALIILLLISPDFIASSYCYDKEMNRAMERHQEGAARVVPIILRPVDWNGAPFGKLQALPKDGRPVTVWRNRDKAFEDVAKGIKKIVNELMPPNPSTSTIPATVPTYTDAASSRDIGEYSIIFTGKVDEPNLDIAEALLEHLRKITKDPALTLIKVKRGSLVLIVKGTREGYERLESLWDSGSLGEINGYSIESMSWNEQSQEKESLETRLPISPVTRVRISPAWGLTEEAFSKLLHVLDPNSEEAGRKLLQYRNRIAKYFEGNRCTDPDELVDIVINRVSRNIYENEAITPSAKYFFSVAKKVLREHYNAKLKIVPLDSSINPTAPDPSPSEQDIDLERHLECLEKCLNGMKPRNRQLLLEYYEGEKHDKIMNRKEMANRLGITYESLHARIFLIRKRLQQDIDACVKSRSLG